MDATGSEERNESEAAASNTPPIREKPRSSSIDLIYKKIFRLSLTENQQEISQQIETNQEKMKSNTKLLQEYEYTLNLIQELRTRNVENLPSVIESLIHNVKSNHLNQHTYSSILTGTKEFLDCQYPSEVRHQIWRLYRHLVEKNSEELGQLRYSLFHLIHHNDTHDEDIPLCIELLIALTDWGKTLVYYETEIAHLMLHLYSKLIEKQDGKWMVKKLSPVEQQNFLRFMINLIKFNAALIAHDPPQALTMMIQYVCQLSFESVSHQELSLVYEFLDVVLCRTHLPSSTVSIFVIVLCVGVNDSSLFERSNKIMKNLIGTYLGFSCLSTLHHLIEDETNYQDTVLMRGAVYFLVQALWGKLANENSSLSANTILPAFKNLIENDTITSPYIMLEMANGIRAFLLSLEEKTTDGTVYEIVKEVVFEYTWEMILDNCHALIFKYNSMEFVKNESTDLNRMICTIIEMLFTFIDQLLPKMYQDEREEGEKLSYKHYFLLNDGFLEKIFAIFEINLNYLKEPMISKLIHHRLTHIGQSRANWIQQIRHLVEQYFILSTSVAIRLHCLRELEKFLSTYHCFVDVDAFWEKVASSWLNLQSDMPTRELALYFLIFIAKKSNSPKNLNEIVDIFESVANHRLKMFPRQHSLEQHYAKPVHATISHQYSAPNTTTEYFDEMILSINGLIVVFVEKIQHTHCHPVAINAFRILIKFSSFFYRQHFVDDPNSAWTRSLTAVKQKIFFMILSIRTNTFGQVGVIKELHNVNSAFQPLPNSDEMAEFSPYILIQSAYSGQCRSPPASPEQSGLQRQQSTSNIFSTFQQTFIEALKLLIDCIEYETDWSVLQIVFVELPKLLKHKALIVTNGAFSTTTSPSSSLNHLNFSDSIPDSLVKVLCKFVNAQPLSQNRLNELFFPDSKYSKSDIYACAYNSIMAIVGYKLHPSNQTAIIKCLQNGLIILSSKISSLRQCIVSLMLCSIEMQTAMIKLIQDIIISLSKISTNKALAVPKLQFLSNVILFPDLYYNFTNKQYLSIFIIAQSYINPYKYGEYTVALALRVISMWFLKCPTSYRSNLVSFLIKGLQTNILLEPGTPQLSQRLSNISTDHRSKLENRLSLTSSPPPPPTTPVSATMSHFSFSFQPSNPDSSSHPQSQHTPISLSSTSAFNVCSVAANRASENLILDPNDKERSKIELVEVCMDMLASNAYTTSSPLPLRPSMIDKLLNKDKSQTWIIGHKLVQITTTGCTSRAIRNGLCNKCFHVCHLNEPIEKEFNSPSAFTTQSSTVLSDRFNTNFNYDLHTSANLISNRRRHRSEVNSSNLLMKNFNLTNDDYFMNRNPTTSSSESDLNAGNDSKYCRCWCQSWAEILIRRSTGNSRLIMRVENSLGDFPYWNLSKEEDESLSNIFKHSDPDINLALKMKKITELKEGQLLDEEEVDSNLDTSVSEPEIESLPNLAAAQKCKVSTPVTRAASFGSRRPLFHHNIHFQQHHQQHTKEHETRLRKLEKDNSFEESESTGNSRTDLTSPVALNSSSETISTATNGAATAAAYRDRGYTISVMTPVQQSGSAHPGGLHHESSMSTSNLSLTNRHSVSPGGLSPQYVFLQFYYNSIFKDEIESLSSTSSEKPILLKKNDSIIRSIGCLDRITPYETHKIGVLYVGPGQANSRSEILSNQIGSYRYTKFLTGLGQLISLENVDQNVCYVGGLDSSTDGKFAISWGDQLIQVIFHVATFMPTLEQDPDCNHKMLHIGNDFVCIMYNNSGQKIDLNSIKGGFGQVHQAMVVITPLENECNIVEIHAKKEFTDFIGHMESHMLSDQSLPVYVRQLALHANLGAMVTDTNQMLKSYHIYNWINRLRNIKRMRDRATESVCPDSAHSTTTPGSACSVGPGRPSPSLQTQLTGGRNIRIINGPGSKDDADSISSATVSPNLPSAGYGSASSNGTFDYEITSLGTQQQQPPPPLLPPTPSIPATPRYSFPDFLDFTSEKN